MIDRRNFLIGAGLAGAVGVAEALRPRTPLLLMPEKLKLTDLIPPRFAGWLPDSGGDIVIPRTEGSLQATLYSDQLARSYRPAIVPPDAPPTPVMLMAAYGKSQSDYLQLHRPEVCYPAIGFSIDSRRFVDLPIAGGRVVPAVAMSVSAGSRVEDLIYWTRLGPHLPRTAGEQRNDRLSLAMRGYIGDGVLVRASAVRSDGRPQFALIERFFKDMVASVAPDRRPALIGRAEA